jgi:SulP family sulfate permease
MFFANKIGHYLYITSDIDADGIKRTYRVIGQVFFSSSEKFLAAFDFKEGVERVVIDVSDAHFWDITAVESLDRAVVKFRREGADVEVIGLNEASATIVDRFGVHDKPEAVDKLIGGH